MIVDETTCSKPIVLHHHRYRRKKGFASITCVEEHDDTEIGFGRKVLGVFEDILSARSCPDTMTVFSSSE